MGENGWLVGSHHIEIAKLGFGHFNHVCILFYCTWRYGT